MTQTDLAIRHFIYQYFVDHTRPPTPIQTAAAFSLTEGEAREVYQRLHDHHFFFLDPGTTNIRLANPLSAIATDFKVTVKGKSYYANCAWDMLGIPAMLHQEGVIHAKFAGTDEKIEIRVQSGQLSKINSIQVVVHFPLPFRQWYDDLIHT